MRREMRGAGDEKAKGRQVTVELRTFLRARLTLAVATGACLAGVLPSRSFADAAASHPRVQGAGDAQPQDLDALLARCEVLGARTGVVALDVGEGRELFARRAQEAFVPASNQKLLTTIGFLQALGPGYRFETRGALERGTLVVRGGGDPNWRSDAEWTPESMFGQWTAALREAGVGAIRSLELLPGAFQGPSRPVGWPGDQLETYYCAPTGAHVLEAGCFRVRVSPQGSNALLDVLAPGPMPIEGAIRVVAGRSRAVYGVRDDGEKLVAHGSMRRGRTPVEVIGAVQDPAAHYVRALRLALAKAGIAVDPQAPATDLQLPALRTPLLPALARALQDSSNFDAEQLLRVLGKERLQDGSFHGGIQALRRELGQLVGPLPDTLLLEDGSGLSRGNRTSPAFLARVLERALRQPWRQTLLDALPRAGRDGTLEDRFSGSPLAECVRCKTGWIRGASALTGVVEFEEGRRRVFSILMNYNPRHSGLNPRLKELQEQIVEAIARLRP
jgi:D-alanyl-D-alanine carboxypeptidase/D-alanyl-D-alanine-endopeptidase (penicillin-binding protein 4)